MMVKANNIVEIIKDNGYDATYDVVNKNGVYIISVAIGSGNVRPSIPIDKDKLENHSEEEIAENIIRIYEKNKDNIDNGIMDLAEMFSDYEKIKGMVIPYLCKGEMPDAVSRKYLDLNVYYGVMSGDMSVLILNKHLEAWNITENELYIQAIRNVKDDFVAEDIEDMLPLNIFGIGSMKGLLYCVHRTDNTYGSAALLLPELFEQFISEDNCPVVIIPSSIHEVLVVGKNTPEINFITDMIRSVNQTTVNPKDVMSDHAYIYMNGEIKEAEND
jgi:hypothetical protein